MVEKNLDFQKLAYLIKKDMLDIAQEHNSYGSHLGGSLSIIEILLSIHSTFDLLSDDILVLSKGHGSLGLYSFYRKVLGIELKVKYNPGETNLGHPVRNLQNKVYVSTGSLGIGMAAALGIALSNKLNKREGYVLVILGDGECNEGIVWECARIANSLKLNNLICIIDMNEYQQTGPTSLISGNYKLASVFRGFGWSVQGVDGHDVLALKRVLVRTKISSAKKKNPCVIIAKTLKGKGISAIEDNNIGHHISLSADGFKEAHNSIQESLHQLEKDLN